MQGFSGLILWAVFIWSIQGKRKHNCRQNVVTWYSESAKKDNVLGNTLCKSENLKAFFGPYVNRQYNNFAKCEDGSFSNDPKTSEAANGLWSNSVRVTIWRELKDVVEGDHTSNEKWDITEMKRCDAQDPPPSCKTEPAPDQIVFSTFKNYMENPKKVSCHGK